jgi:hypothetical protein
MKPLAIALVLVALIWALSTQLLPYLNQRESLRLLERKLAIEERSVTIQFLAPVIERVPAHPGEAEL